MKTWITALTLMAAGTAFAQQAHHETGGSGIASPYAGFQEREIKSLSGQQLADLRAGKGMSLALAAELNGYPGPAHALELSDALALSHDQKKSSRALFEQMQSEAVALGERLIESERRLDALFRAGKATPESVQAATAEAARLQGELRYTHLSYHFRMMDLLTPGQVEQYNRLRGYR